MNRLLLKIFSGCGILLTLACAPLPRIDGAPGTETVKALDGIKLISTDISRGDDPSSFGQRSYTISPSSRLLVRYESLSSAAPRILATQPMYIRIQNPHYQAIESHSDW